MTQHAMPLLVINMGGEMVYILQQRLQAQKIPPEKSEKVSPPKLEHPPTTEYPFLTTTAVCLSRAARHCPPTAYPLPAHCLPRCALDRTAILYSCTPVKVLVDVVRTMYRLVPTARTLL